MALQYQVTPLTAEQAKAASGWTYGPGCGLYDFTAADLPPMRAPRYRYHAVCDAEALAGIACFGEAAQVQGGPYRRPALDVGCSMAPARVGAGQGRSFVAAVVDFAIATYAPILLRLSVAEGNHRAIRVFEATGFITIGRFAGIARGGIHRFLLMTRVG